MAMTKKLDSPKTFDNLASRQGGSFFLNEDKSYLSYDNGYMSLARSLRTNKGLLFKFSIFNYYENKEEVELGMLINPTDITIGQSFIASNSYTRQALLSTLWGSQQQTITCAGTSPAFFIGTDTRGVGRYFKSGLTTANRKETLGFINFMSLVAMYKNNGNYFLDGDQNASLYNNKSGYGNKGRVIGVMDSILLSYDGSEYVGSFSAFTLDEDPARPFNLRYNFEFIVSCMRGDAMDGHLRMRGNDIRSSDEPQIPISIQGRGVTLTTTVGMSTSDLNEHFKIFDDKYEQTFEEWQKEQKDGTGDEGDEGDEGDDGSGSSSGKPGTKNSAGTMVNITEGTTKIKDLTGTEIASIAAISGAGRFSTESVDAVIALYGQKAPGSSLTYAQLMEKGAKFLHYDLDPVLLTTIITVESGGNVYFKNGVAVARTNVVGDKGKSFGITQIHKPTYTWLSSQENFPLYMAEMGFTGPLSHDRCKTDPSYGMAVSLYLLDANANSEYSKIGQDPVKAIIGYNAGPGRLDKQTLQSGTTTRYINAWTSINSNQALVTKINNKIK